MSHVTQKNQSCHTYESGDTPATHKKQVMSHTWMSRVTCTNDLSHIRMSYTTHLNESCHTSEWVTSRIWYLFIHVCMYSCVCMCMYVCMYACMHACIRVFVHVCMYTCMNVFMYVRMYVHVHASLHVHRCDVTSETDHLYFIQPQTASFNQKIQKQKLNNPTLFLHVSRSFVSLSIDLFLVPPFALPGSLTLSTSRMLSPAPPLLTHSPLSLSDIWHVCE